MPRRFKKNRSTGLTFLEVIVVIGLIGVIAASVIQQGFSTPKSVSLVGLAEQTQYTVAAAVLTAKSAQATAKLYCDETGIYADFFKSNGAMSRRSNAIGYSLDAAGRTALGNASWRQSVLRLEPSVTLTCPSCGQVYVSSDGSLLYSSQCSELSYIFAQNSNINGYTSQAKVRFHWNGFGEIYARQVQSADQNSQQWASVLR